MARIIVPPLNQHHLLRQPLTLGEARVLDFFDANLPEGWEIYVQPHLNGLRPDFILLNPYVGIAVYEVKDWNLDALPYFVQTRNEVPVLLSTNKDGVTFAPDNPVKKVTQYKSEILTLYCPSLGVRVTESEKIVAVVTAGVIFTHETTRRVAELLRPFCDDGNWAEYHPIAGNDLLNKDGIKKVLPSSKYSRSNYMTPELADDIRSWLREPDHAAEQRQPLPLDARQRELATTRTASGFRRVKGAAGSGKSLVLAARATHLADEGKSVLVVSFNITLLHYLRDLAVRYPHKRGSVINGVTWLHFHDWCKRVCQEAGMTAEYNELLGGMNELAYEERNRILEVEIPLLVGNALKHEQQRITHYDAILVDEGQDFNLTWWNLLRQVCNANGEKLLMADTTQDLYQRSCHWDLASLKGAGFPGKWIILEGSYRFPDNFIPHLRHYATEFLHTGEITLPTKSSGNVFEQNLFLNWLQVSEGKAVDTCVEAICDLPRNQAVTWADITLLVATHEIGLECVHKLQLRSIKTNHVFSENDMQKKALKNAFWMGDSRVKAATVHSFKGWESRAMVVHINRATTPEELSSVYVALSRLRRSENGSFLTVVCSAPELEAYGRTWKRFEKRD